MRSKRGGRFGPTFVPLIILPVFKLTIKRHNNTKANEKSTVAALAVWLMLYCQNYDTAPKASTSNLWPPSRNRM